jgi:hypothetical protein
MPILFWKMAASSAIKEETKEAPLLNQPLPGKAGSSNDKS